MTDTSSLSESPAFHARLAPLPEEVPRARQAVRQWLRSSQLGCDWATAELLVSELVTNALRHARPPLELRVQPLDGTGVRIEVFDGTGDRLPVLDVSPLDADGGRGIEIVAALASRWGSEPGAPGKIVWAELD
jgi:anti-sigma regulatory factor (Ser/Thr protein kinase)